MRAIIPAAFLIVLLQASCGNQDYSTATPALQQDILYPEPWLSDGEEFGSIASALMQNSIQDCGEFYYRLANGEASSGEALVYCTRDGQNWTHYLVFYRVGNIVPTGAVPGVPMPTR